jgi:hypothetical protein
MNDTQDNWALNSRNLQKILRFDRLARLSFPRNKINIRKLDQYYKDVLMKGVDITLVVVDSIGLDSFLLPNLCLSLILIQLGLMMWVQLSTSSSWSSGSLCSVKIKQILSNEFSRWINRLKRCSKEWLREPSTAHGTYRQKKKRVVWKESLARIMLIFPLNCNSTLSLLSCPLFFAHTSLTTEPMISSLHKLQSLKSFAQLLLKWLQAIPLSKLRLKSTKRR